MMKFKEGVDPADLLYLTSKMMEMLQSCHKHFFSRYNIEMIVTSIKSDRKGVKSKSTTHEDFRAVDLRSSHMTPSERTSFVAFCNREFLDIGAISASDLECRPVVYHDAGMGSHFHLQVRP